MFAFWCVATKPIVASATGFREFGKCDVFTDNNRTTCGAVTSPDNPLDFVLRANFSQPQTHFHPRISLRGGNCGDASQVRACVFACVRACVRVCVRACVRVHGIFPFCLFPCVVIRISTTPHVGNSYFAYSRRTVKLSKKYP